MRLSLGSVPALAAAMLIAFAFWPENRAAQGPRPLFAQKSVKPEHAAPAKPSHPPAHAPSKTPTPPPIVADHPLSSDVGQHPKIEAALEATTDFTIDPEPLKDALDFIAQHFQIPIMLDNRTLEDASIDVSAEVRLPISGLKLRQVLTLLLKQLPQPLGFDIQDGVLRISTIEKIAEHRVVVVYDCRDLVQLRSIYPGAGMSHRTESSQGVMGGGMGGGVFSVGSAPPEIARQFGGGTVVKPAKKPDKPAKIPCAQSEIPLIRVIQYAGDPDDWKAEDGEGARITELGGLLVVNQNPMVHEQIKRILADLRRMRKQGAFAASENDHNAAATTSSPGKAADGL